MPIVVLIQPIYSELAGTNTFHYVDIEGGSLVGDERTAPLFIDNSFEVVCQIQIDKYGSNVEKPGYLTFMNIK